MEREYLIMTGSINPFTSNGNGEHDLPSEMVTIKNEANPDYSVAANTEQKVDAENKEAVASQTADTSTTTSTGETERELEPKAE
jgi:hypothetical protein